MKRILIFAAVAICSMLAVACMSSDEPVTVIVEREVMPDAEATRVATVEHTPAVEIGVQSNPSVIEPFAAPSDHVDLDSMAGRKHYFEMCFEVNPSWSERFAAVGIESLYKPTVAQEVAERWWSAVEESGREDICLHLQNAFEYVQNR